jgi:hypothetical protein
MLYTTPRLKQHVKIRATDRSRKIIVCERTEAEMGLPNSFHIMTGP